MIFNAVILAAGTGRRLRGIPKFLIKINGITLIENLIKCLRQAGINKIIVVTGFQSEKLKSICLNQRVDSIYNPNFENGNHQESLEIALKSMRQMNTNHHTIITLVDQPLLNTVSITNLLNHYKAQNGSIEALYPVNNNERGNPMLVSNNLLKIALETKPFNLKEFIKHNQHKVMEFETSEAGYFSDIDTEFDVQHLYATHGVKLELPLK